MASHHLDPAAPVDQRTEQLLARLFENANFDQFAALIEHSLSIDNTVWHHVICMRADPSTFFHTHYLLVTQVPPPDIFQIISDLRNSPGWHPSSTHTVEILRRVRNRIAGQSLDPRVAGHLRPPSARLPSQGSAFPLTSPTSSSDYLRPRRARSTRQTDSVQTDSVQTDIGSFTGNNAPAGWRFRCRVCAWAGYSKAFIRRGHYLRHMAKQHSQSPPPHDNSSLRRISSSVSTGEEAPLDGHDTSIPNNQQRHGMSSRPRPETTLPDVVQARGPEIHINAHDIDDSVGGPAPSQNPYYFDEYLDNFDPDYMHP